MIKKLVSDALLSLVMDKNARDTLDARKTIKKAVKQIEEATGGKGLDAVAKAGGGAASGVGGDSEETRKLILDSIAAAEREFLEKPKMSPGRQALIQQAMSVQRSKEHVLDGLSAEQREKLYVVALKSLKPDRAATVKRRAQRYTGRPRKR